MKSEFNHGNASVDRHGQVGSHATHSFKGGKTGEWDGHYEFSTHGMTAADVKAKIDALAVYHGKKCARLNAWEATKAIQITVAGDVWQIVDVNLYERGTDVELYVAAVLVGGRERLEIERRYATVDDLPTDPQIVQAVRAKLIQKATANADHAAFVQQVQAMIDVPKIP